MDASKRAIPVEASVAAGALVVLGLGNPIRRDDAAGLEVARRTARNLAGTPLEPEVCFRECCAGAFDVLDEVVGFEELVVVDSWHTEQSVPGHVRVLEPADLGAPSPSPANPHLLALPQALAWAARAGLRVPRLRAVVVVEVGEECLEFGEGLTDQVSAAIPAAVRELERVVREVLSDLESFRCRSEVHP